MKFYDRDKELNTLFASVCVLRDSKTISQEIQT